MKRAVLIAALAVFPNLAAAAMTGEEFEDYVTGQTLTFAENGVIYGIEEYLPNRRVRWAFVGDQCQDGIWYEADGKICFLYEDRPDDPQCWVFTRDEGRLNALFAGTEDERRLYEAARTDEPLICPGPDVGV